MVEAVLGAVVCFGLAVSAVQPAMLQVVVDATDCCVGGVGTQVEVAAEELPSWPAGSPDNTDPMPESVPLFPLAC